MTCNSFVLVMSPISTFRIPERGFQTHNDIYSIHGSIQDTSHYDNEILSWIYSPRSMKHLSASIQYNKGYLSFRSYRIMRENLSLLPQTCVQRPLRPGFTSSGANERRWNGSIPTPEKGPLVVFQPSFLRGYASLQGSIPFHFWKVSNLQSLLITPFHHHVATSQNQI